MFEWILLIHYNISQGICSNASMTRWLPLVATIVGDSVLGRFDVFLKEVHRANEVGLITPVLMNVLRQFPLWRDEASAQVDELQSQGIMLIPWFDNRFPASLKIIPDSPVLLYCYGNLILLQRSLVSIVGTRNASHWGSIKAAQLAVEATSCGYITVSGGAKGIDSVVRDYSQRCGETVTVLPSLTDTERKSAGGSGLICSEYTLIRPEFEKWKYIARNRIIAALSHATIVVEAPIRSGTLHTVDFAQMYDRSVYFVLPSGIHGQNYGGYMVALARIQNEFVLSFYDVVWRENDINALLAYYLVLKKISSGRILISSQEYRHLGTVDLVKNHYVTGKDVIELERLGIVCRRKGTVLINFSESRVWQKISLS